jgi:sporulation protein YlmC with PRC-barrel domain
MRLRYREIVGRHAVTSDGHDAGRVADLVVAPDGDDLSVVALLLGPSSLLRRIVHRGPRRVVAWSSVARLGDRIELRIGRAELERAGRVQGDQTPRERW